jgi:ABC-type multidrug transport system ATPase subunit
MSALLEFEGFSLRGKGPKLTLAIRAGQSLAVLGPAGSGKSLLLERVADGAAGIRTDAVVHAGELGGGRKATPQSISLRDAGPREPVRAAEVLSLLNLWEARHTPINDLTPSQLAACELIPPLLSQKPVMLLDGQLDRLDPWVLPFVIAALKERLEEGACLVAATNRLEQVPEFDALIVLRDQQIRFAGGLSDLMHQGPPWKIEVETTDQEAARALVEPFHVKIEAREGGLRMWASEGQEVAARLLLEGYGNVKFLLVQKPTVQQALQDLLSS